MKEVKIKSKGSKSRVTGQGLKVTVNPELDKYDNVILAPKKVAEAKEAIKKLDFPKIHKLIAHSK